jgi:heterodisulfide reductase subunit A-like polyferredoxin
MSETVLVIGGGPAGLETSRGVAELGTKVIRVEKNLCSFNTRFS